MLQRESCQASQPVNLRLAFQLSQTANQPLKVQLKRKHWAGEGTEAATASKRCTEIFERQVGHGPAALAGPRGRGARPVCRPPCRG